MDQRQSSFNINIEHGGHVNSKIMKDWESVVISIAYSIQKLVKRSTLCYWLRYPSVIKVNLERI